MDCAKGLDEDEDVLLVFMLGLVSRIFLYTGPEGRLQLSVHIFAGAKKKAVSKNFGAFLAEQFVLYEFI